MRIFDILHILAAQQIIKGEHLANELNVSTRTIRTDLKELAALLSEHGATIKSLKGAGYKLEIWDEQRFNHLLKKLKEQEIIVPEQTSSSPEARINYIIRKLLLTKAYVKLDDLAETLYVSRYTLQSDLKDMRKILAAYGLSLENRPHNGIKIKGSEAKLRYCISDYLFGKRDEIGDRRISTLPMIPDEDMELIREIILERIELNQIELSDIALNNLMIHIAIACKRIRDGNYVSYYPSELKKIEAQKEFNVASEIVHDLEQQMGHSFPVAEIAYIAVHLLGVRTIVTAHMNEEDIKTIIDQDIYDLTVEILDQIEQQLKMDIRSDKELLVGLCLHLKPLINRHKYGMNSRNPMLDKIKAHYPLAFEAGIIAAEIIKLRLGIQIEENEIGYMAIHIGGALERKKMEGKPKRTIIVCASGLGSAKLLYYKLQSIFGSRLEIVGITGLYKLKQMSLDTIDFVISTIPLSEPLSVPLIHVNTFLDGSDIHKLESTLSEAKLPAVQYVRKKMVFLQQKFDSKLKVLEFLSQKIQAADLVNGPLLESVIEREAVSPTAFGNLVAIPHPMEPLAHSTFWAICTLQKAIDWDGKPVQFVCMLCIQRRKTEDLQNMYNIMLGFLNNENLVQRLIRCKTYTEFVQTLYHHNE
ncbi:BglG family transcription antiterminator [Paenibacillus peoriae]|uniref:BglG family transcription antiterminator n=1 Tax=Paenibacillus peoriae TaxID=59893 RepID=UPI00026C5849|nr:BglG family transcription antiterminator [Paenibacillus peoriae]MEC0182408.1 BglG family transcription antiterminator [Paenibacillus peoriae]